MTEAERNRLLAVQASLSAGDVDRALEMAVAAVADGIEHPLVLSLAAGQLETAGRNLEALGLLQRAKSLAPEAAGILNAVGLCLQRLDRMEEAASEFGDAIAAMPDFAPAWANRAACLMALSKLPEARRDFEQALHHDPDNLIALNGMAALAVRRGDADTAISLASRVLVREPGFPGAAIALAEAYLTRSREADAEATLRNLLDHAELAPLDRAIATGVLADALDAQHRYDEAFDDYSRSGALFARLPRAVDDDNPTPQALLRATRARLEKISLPPSAKGPAGSPRRHIFLIGFPRSGTTLLEQVLEQHPDAVTLAEKECLPGSLDPVFTDLDLFERFCRLPDDALAKHRRDYWRRVAEEGIDPANKLFVDKHPFHSFKLPVLLKLFPDATILFAQRDPRDIVLSCFRRRFQLNGVTRQFLTLTDTADLYDASMALVEDAIQIFEPDLIRCRLEDVVADFEGAIRHVCERIGLSWTSALGEFANTVGERGVFTPSGPQLAGGLNAQGIDKWRDYAAPLAPVLPRLDPWIRRFGYA